MFTQKKKILIKTITLFICIFVSYSFASYLSYIAGMDFSPLPDKRPTKYGQIIDWGCSQCDANPYYRNSLRLLVEGSSVIVKFRVTQSYEKAVLAVTHLSSYGEGLPGNGTSPVTIKVNGSTVTSGFCPASYHNGGHGYFTDLWDITPYLKTGVNTIKWVADDLSTHYWLQRFIIAGK